ncbi:MAG: diadenylate cyclase CdaA [Clostridia bacterium]|nr:diadenylate cyclase CdaA [Clostridia bacterium]
MDFFKEKVIDTLLSMDLWDALDIILLACAFFFVYRFAKKRRAIKLIIGVVLLLGLMLFVDAVKLSALGFVFGDFKQLGLIALIIIFQPELRSALEKIGGIRVFNFHVNHNDKNSVSAHYVIESVSRAAQRLSSAGHGALIVIERHNSLAEYKRSGSSIDAVISPDMLCSIFYKGTALHDGAVIIRDGRIDSAACVLPMTSRVDIDSELGTRHRAAIGTTEVSDAIVVIVSEETGKISLSIDGELERGFTYSTLRAKLEDILIPKDSAAHKQKSKIARSSKDGKRK